MTAATQTRATSLRLALAGGLPPAWPHVSEEEQVRLAQERAKQLAAEEKSARGFPMVFQAHLVLLIKERGFAKAARTAWDITERLRKEGHEAYVASIESPGTTAKRQRSRGTPPGRTKAESVSS